MARKASKPDKDGSDSITIKKYANRRLYNTAASSYVTLDDLATIFPVGTKRVRHFAGYTVTNGEVHLIGDFLGFFDWINTGCDNGHANFLKFCFLVCEAD